MQEHGRKKKEVSFCENSLGTKQPCVRQTDAVSKNVCCFFGKRAATFNITMIRAHFRVFIVVTFWSVLIANARCVEANARIDRRTNGPLKRS